MSLEAGKAIEKALILAGQLEEVSLFLLTAREEKEIMAPKNEYIICRLVIPRIRDNTT
jgi:hypothetical protein